MHTVSKSLLTLSICLGLSGAVYAQTAPSTAKPATTTEPAKAKPAATTLVKAVKEKPAAVSGESASPAPKAKHEHTHAAAAPKPAIDKTTKLESADAKKLETNAVKDSKNVAAKPEANKAAEPAKPAEHTAAASNVHKSMKHEAKPSEKPAESTKTVK